MEQIPIMLQLKAKNAKITKIEMNSLKIFPQIPI